MIGTATEHAPATTGRRLRSTSADVVSVCGDGALRRSTRRRSRRASTVGPQTRIIPTDVGIEFSPHARTHMEIVRYPHPALRWKSKPVTAITPQLRKTVRRMFELMYESKGIGLAANQVALPYRLFVVNVTADLEQKDEELVFINPEIVQRKGSAEGEEGCLSLPELYGPVRRAEEIRVEAFDLEGLAFEMTLSDLQGRAVQHEYDHLDGVLFVDRMSESARREVEPTLEIFESHFRRQQAANKIPRDEEIQQRLRELQPQQ